MTRRLSTEERTEIADRRYHELRNEGWSNAEIADRAFLPPIDDPGAIPPVDVDRVRCECGRYVYVEAAGPAVTCRICGLALRHVVDR